MVARSESWSPRADATRAAAAAATGIALFALAWALLHFGFYDESAIVDTPVYQGYGEAVARGDVPYRDFAVEYPPAALPVFVVPALGADKDYEGLFEVLMLACGAVAVGLLAVTLVALGAPSRRLYGALAFAALSPLLLGSVILTRYDLWPAALTAGALAALASGRARLGLGALALAVGAKIYPLVLLPLALLYVARRRGRPEAIRSLGVFVLVLALIFLPFVLLASDGVLASFERQAGRPLQIESLGAGFLLGAHRLGLYEAAVASSHGSQNLVGSLPDVLASVQTVSQLLAVVAVWAAFARVPAGREAFVTASAAAVVAFVAFGKVLSPQFLIWLLPLVPLVAGRIGFASTGLLALALVLTQLWFPSRYWDVVALRPVAWLVVLRDLVLVGLFLALLAAIRRKRGRADTA